MNKMSSKKKFKEFKKSELKLENKRKWWRDFLIQIGIAVGIMLIYLFAYDLRYGSTFITSLSAWYFAFSISYIYNQDNEIINNYLFCCFIVMLIIIFSNIIRFLSFWDFLHLIPVAINVHIIWKKKKTLKLSYIILFQFVMVSWIYIVRILELNYVILPLEMGVFFAMFYSIATITLGVIVIIIYNKYEKT
jgi:hypothetical protein